MATHDSLAGNVLKSVKTGLDSVADGVVPWFYANMPDYYFKTHSTDDQVQHLQTIISGRVTTDSHTVNLVAPDRKTITYIAPKGSEVALLEILQGHVGDSIETARLYSSYDGQLKLCTILLSEQPKAQQDSAEFAEAVNVSIAEGLIREDEREDYVAFLAGANSDYVQKYEPSRAVRHYRTMQELTDSEDTFVSLEQCSTDKESRIAIAMINPPSTGLLLQVTKILNREGLSIRRAYGDLFTLTNGKTFAVLSFYVRYKNDLVLPDSELWHKLTRKLNLVKWFAPHDLERYADEEGWPLKRVMLLQAACEFAHVFLVKDNLWAYTADNVVNVALVRRDEIVKLVEYFEARFDPSRGNRQSMLAELEQMIGTMLDECVEENERRILNIIYGFFRNTLRTNYYLDQIYGLSFRIDSAFMVECSGGCPKEDQPYGVFFFHGPYAQGFHVRYRDMARGGVRVVTTRTQEQFELESNRLYDEVTALARAQHYKNKDIPEGGSKAVMLLGPRGDINLAVYSMINSLLDIILTGEDSPALSSVVDYLGKEEIIYLGPDEHITPEHIEWTIKRARERGYRWPSAFMSSKPKAGINHKEFGVTSLGVMVFADEVLRSMGIAPEQERFTCKITGGPKGDVAGNVMKILHRDYGENARVVAITDGHGAAYDPDGLAWDELFRLIEIQKSIDAFDRTKLTGEGAFVVSADTPENARIRNTLHNKAVADIFIPSGGRPDTINMKNWRDFFDESGTPSARAIVEGANLFISPDARQKIAEKDVLIVHGSSANKTGVICSSYEILGGLVMTEDEFIANKKDYVEGVFEILRKRARDEARLLLRERKKCDNCKPLHEISVELSTEINRVADALYSSFVVDQPDIANDPLLCELLLEYCPAVLVEQYRDRIFTQVPLRHQYSLISAYIASRIVYQEGMGWLNELAHTRDVRQVMRNYRQAEHTVSDYVEALRKATVADVDSIVELMESGGRRLLVMQQLGLV
ncbi:NAD-glutamate dehydrogenase domain-containing protein [Oleidesulfovibrio sp.]|uniref:NAD-glutamate dehydrogenase domain-containing protein n=1 Tax=Oleidesulfovibrio sp. TaxID=2909707 RepID=UPI003A83A915